jgi:hypothetical protein
MRGTSFVKSLPTTDDLHARTTREELVLDAVENGVALPIEWLPLQLEAPGHQGVLFVSSDTLRFGEAGPNADPTDWDWVRIALTATSAQQVADLLGVLLPTDRIADLVFGQADVVLTPHTQQVVTATTAAMLQHHAAIEAERNGRTGLLATVGKEWILGSELYPAGHPAHPLGPTGAINYGWHTTGPARPGQGPFQGRGGFVLWQTRGFRHDRAHVDYSQWVPRLVHPRMIVDGAELATADVMMDARLAPLVSYDGPLPGTRYPGVAPVDAVVTQPPLPLPGGSEAEPPS